MAQDRQDSDQITLILSDPKTDTLTVSLPRNESLNGLRNNEATKNQRLLLKTPELPGEPVVTIDTTAEQPDGSPLPQVEITFQMPRVKELTEGSRFMLEDRGLPHSIDMAIDSYRNSFREFFHTKSVTTYWYLGYQNETQQMKELRAKCDIVIEYGMKYGGVGYWKVRNQQNLNDLLTLGDLYDFVTEKCPDINERIQNKALIGHDGVKPARGEGGPITIVFKDENDAIIQESGVAASLSFDDLRRVVPQGGFFWLDMKMPAVKDSLIINKIGAMTGDEDEILLDFLFNFPRLQRWAGETNNETRLNNMLNRLEDIWDLNAGEFTELFDLSPTTPNTTNSDGTSTNDIQEAWTARWDDAIEMGIRIRSTAFGHRTLQWLGGVLPAIEEHLNSVEETVLSIVYGGEEYLDQPMEEKEAAPPHQTLSIEAANWQAKALLKFLKQDQPKTNLGYAREATARMYKFNSWNELVAALK